MNNIEGYIGGNELIFNTDYKTNIHSGGFNVNSIMMRAGMSPIITMNDQSGGGSDGNLKNVSDLFNSLVIPCWLTNYNSINEKYEDDDDEEDEVIDDKLHTELIELAKKSNLKKKSTHKNKIKTNKTKTSKTSKTSKTK